MTLTLYGTLGSIHTVRALLTIFEKDVTDYKLVPVSMAKGENKQPEYLKLQPFGQLPVLQDGDITLFESRAIARYVAQKFEKQGTPLYGYTPKDKALVEQWLEVESQNYNPPIAALAFELVFHPLRGLPTNQAVVDANFVKLEKVLDIYEAQFQKTKYLAGDFFSLADLSHIPFTDFLINRAKKGEVFEKRPHVKAWWDDISCRPSSKKLGELAAAPAAK